jgi:Ras-like protein family protein 10B
VASSKKAEYFPSLVLNESLFELKVIDLPAITHFPDSPDAEWTDFR